MLLKIDVNDIQELTNFKTFEINDRTFINNCFKLTKFKQKLQKLVECISTEVISELEIVKEMEYKPNNKEYENRFILHFEKTYWVLVFLKN